MYKQKPHLNACASQFHKGTITGIWTLWREHKERRNAKPLRQNKKYIENFLLYFSFEEVV